MVNLRTTRKHILINRSCYRKYKRTFILKYVYPTGERTHDHKPLDMKPSNERHYRVTALHENWTNYQPRYVKLALYKDNQEVAYIVFNGAGSTINNWFSADRLVDSRWPHMKPTTTYNFFSLEGSTAAGNVRRFHINLQYDKCPNDLGYLAVIEKKGGCNWDKHYTFPQFLYAPDNTPTWWDREHFGRADYLAIYLSQ